MTVASSPLKVTFILPAFYRNGAVNVYVSVAERAACHNIASEFLVLRECERHAPLPQAPVKHEIVLKEHQSTLSGLPKLLYKMVRSIMSADVVVYTWENGILIPGIIAYILRKPTVAVVQNNFQRVSEQNEKRERERKIRRWVYNRCKAIVCAGSGLISTIEPGIARDKVTSIQNGTDIEKVRRLAKDPCTHQVAALVKNDVPYIIGVGRLSDQKGFDVLIKAHADAVDQGRWHRLVLVGEGEKKDELLALVEKLGVADSVVFLGFLDNPYPAIAHASLFCLSSRYEGFALVGSEAAALGVPTVATNCVAGPKELLEDGKYGDLVEVDDVEGLSAAIQRHFENPQRLMDKAKASAQAAERLSLTFSAARYSELFHQYAKR